MDNLDLITKEECTGCSACFNACPLGCIEMSADERGFLHPVVDHLKCIDCGLCRRICPVLNKDCFKSPSDSVFYGCKHKDDSIRRSSSSGGFFYELANRVIGDGGVVCGARFSSDFKKVYHSIAYTDEGVQPLRLSKYVQSEVGDTFSRVKDLLETGRKVLFTGTPCQVAGLRAFLSEEYDNLLSVEVICHGVPSPKVWDYYLSSLEKSYDGKASFVCFRDKYDSWRNYSFTVGFDNGRVFRETSKDNAYMQSFLNDLNIRESCIHCNFKRFTSGADITMGDFWGSTEMGEGYSDDIGISVIGLHTEKAKVLFDALFDSLEGVRGLSEKEAFVFNESYVQCAQDHPSRSLFFDRYDKDDFSIVVSDLCKSLLPEKNSGCLFRRFFSWIRLNNRR